MRHGDHPVPRPMVVIMRYEIILYDTWGRCIAVFDEVPLLDVIRATPDDADCIRGLLPADTPDLGHAYRVEVRLDGARVCEGRVELLRPCWSDAKKLILDRYVTFHELLEIEARSTVRAGNTRVARTCVQREISAAVKDVINAAPGPSTTPSRTTPIPTARCANTPSFSPARPPRTNSNTAASVKANGSARTAWTSPKPSPRTATPSRALSWTACPGPTSA